MTPLKTLTIQGQTFMQGRTECDCCGHAFKFILSKEVLIFWEGLCAQCSQTMPFTMPQGTQIIIEGLAWDS